MTQKESLNFLDSIINSLQSASSDDIARMKEIYEQEKSLNLEQANASELYITAATATELVDEYQQLNPLVVQEQIKPIIQSYRREFLAATLGVSVHTLYQYCKKNFATQGKKPDFAIYMKLMMLGINHNPTIMSSHKPLTEEEKQVREQLKQEREKRRAERQVGTVGNLKAYQHQYYMKVTKPKRQAKRKEQMKDD